jgi:predicted nucleotide-binding protein
MAKLGRERVCILYQTGVEKPSNISGIADIRYSGESKWQDELKRELEYAGLKLQS